MPLASAMTRNPELTMSGETWLGGETIFGGQIVPERIYLLGEAGTGDGRVGFIREGAWSIPRWSTDDGGARLRRMFHSLGVGEAFSGLVTQQYRGNVQHERSRQAIADAPHHEALRWIRDATGLSKERIGRLIAVSRQAIYQWERGMPIADLNRRRLLAVRDVLERAALQNPQPGQLAVWLDSPRGAEGRTPAELLEAGEIDRARLLAVTSPSPRVNPPPAWVRRPVPEAFRAGAEHPREAGVPDQDDELFRRFGEPGSDEDEETSALVP